MSEHLSFHRIARFVWKYISQKPFWLALIAINVVLQAVSELLWPYLIGELTAYVAESTGDPLPLFEGGLKYILFLALNSVVYWTLRISNHYAYDRLVKMPAMKQAGVDTFAKIQNLSTDWHESSFAGSTVRKITRGMYALQVFTDRFYDHFFPMACIIIGVCTSLFLRWPSVAAILTIGMVLYIAMSIYLSTRFITPVARAHAKGDNQLGAALADSISCNAVVRSFGREKEEHQRLENVAENWFQRFWRNYFVHNTVNLSQSIVSSVLLVTVFMGIVWIWAQGNADVADVTFVMMSFYLLIEYLKNIDNAVRELQSATRDLEDMVRFADMEPQVTDITGAENLHVPKGSIEFQNISFSYPEMHTPVYRDLSLSIAPGEKIALVGHSGGGKSTFVKLLQRLYNIDSGAILIDGQDISEVTLESLRQNIALVPQEPLLFHRPIAENIAYGRPVATMEEIENAARLAHAHEFISHLSQGYQTLVGERGIKLSGGERQRIAIARAMLADAPILILDEATSSLDSQSEKLIQDALQQLLAEKTAIIIAHRLSTVKAADRILVFADGKIVESGSHQTLLRKKNGIYRGMFELQAGGFLHEDSDQ